MDASALPSAASLADISARLARILNALLYLVGNNVYRHPFLHTIILPFWRRIARDTGRLQRLLARLADGKLPATRHGKPRGPRKTTYSKPELPTEPGWLLKHLTWHAAGLGSQLEYLLAQPEAAPLLEIPAFARIVNPFRRMLGNRRPAPRPPRPKRAPPAQEPRPAKPIPAHYRARLARIPARHRPVVEAALRRLLPDPAPD